MGNRMLWMLAAATAAAVGGCAASHAVEASYVMNAQDESLGRPRDRGPATAGSWGDPSLAPPAGEGFYVASGVSGEDKPPTPEPTPDLSVDFQRRIVYTGRFAIDVEDVGGAVEKAAALAEAAGGYVQQQTHAEAVLRVPAEQFHETVRRVEQFGVVTEKRLDAQDVTEQYVDLNLRLEARQAYLDQLKKMLADARDMAVMLEIQKELARAVEEIESLQGKLRYLGHRIRFATIAVTFRPLHGRGRGSFSLPFPWLDRLGLGHVLSD